MSTSEQDDPSLATGYRKSLEDLQQRTLESQQQTLEHLSALKSALHLISEIYSQSEAESKALLVSAQQLVCKLRGIDLLTGRVAELKKAVDTLETQVKQFQKT